MRSEAEHAEATRRVHEAIGGLLDDGEFALAWVLQIDVAGPDDARYLAHRAGGGPDGSDSPMSWTALGMIQAAAEQVKMQVADCTEDVDFEDDDE